MPLSAPHHADDSIFNLPWTLTGGRGILGLGPIRGAVVLWLGLMAFIVLFVLLAALISRWQWGRANRADARVLASEIPQLSPGERARLRTEASDLIRQAAATAAAAKRAESAVAETRAVSIVAQQARETAWSAFDTAQRAYEEAMTAAQQELVPTPPGDEDEDEKREVSKAALAAFRRGDISVDDLGAAFRQASGWDPLHELQAREVELRRSAESQARKAYQAATAAEKTAVQAADVAEVSAQALAEEAIEVAQEAQAVREELTAALRERPAGKAERRAARKVARQTVKIPRQKRRKGPDSLPLSRALEMVGTLGLGEQTIDLSLANAGLERVKAGEQTIDMGSYSSADA